MPFFSRQRRLIRFRSTLLVAIFTLLTFQGPAMSQTIHALVIGIDQYRYGTSLRGAVNDAKDIADALEHSGVQDLTVLLNDEASRDRIIFAWNSMLDGAVKGDELLVTYAGHGAQEPERVSGSEADGRDEVLLLGGFESAGAATRERIIDDEFFQWFSKAAERGLEVIFVADACYSGSLTRSVDPRAGVVSYRVAPNYRITSDMLEIPRSETLTKAREDGLSHVTLFAAGQENEKIPEIMVRDSAGQSKVRGALSYVFARALEGAADYDRNGVLSRREMQLFIRENVRILSEARQTPNLLPRDAEDEPMFRVPEGARGSASGAKLVNLQQTRLALLGVDEGERARLKNSVIGATIVPLADTPDLIWDARINDAVTGLGDVVAGNVTALTLQGVIDKWRAVQVIRAMSQTHNLIMQIQPDDRTHRSGDVVGLEVSGISLPFFTLFSISGDGTVHYHYPWPQDSPSLPAAAPFRLEFSVIPPFGADHFVAIASDEPLTELNNSLGNLDGKRAGRSVIALLENGLTNANYQMGIQGLYTAK